MRKPRFESEKELAKSLVAWLAAERWEVYQEVQGCGGLCDIVAKRGGATWAIECKLALNLEVIAQALNWRHRANLVSVAVPYRGELHRSCSITSRLGIGILGVHHPAESNSVREFGHAAFMRVRAGAGIALHEQQKTFCEAGGNRGGYYSEFKATCSAIRRAVEANPGITLKDLLEGTTYHYSTPASARGAIAKCAADGIIEGVELRRVGKALTLYPKR